MPRHTMTSPLSVLVAGVTVIVLLLISSGASTSAVTLQQTRTPVVWTPCGDEDNECIDYQDNATASAEAYGIPSPYAGPANGTNTVTGTATTTATTTGTADAITGTLTPGTPQRTPAAGQTSPETPTDVATAEQAAEAAPTATATPSDTIECAPGVPVAIAGEGPPRAPVLLYFGERPVGGGSVGPDGRFALKLTVGQERAGDYKVTARVRGTAQVLREITCAVPAASPTPLPAAR